MAKRSLASMSETPGTAVAEVPQGGAMTAPMQSRLTQPVAVSAPGAGITVPNVRFASSKSESWAKWVQQVPGLANGDVLLFGGDGSVVKLPVLRFFLIHATEYICQFAGDFVSILKAWRHDATGVPEVPRPTQSIEACGLVFDPAGRLVPARLSFRDATCKAVQTAAAELVACTTVEWGQQSEAHRMAQQLQPPYRRFVVEVATQFRTGKGSGNRYLAASAKCTPVIDAMTLQALANADRDPATRELFLQVEESYLKRCGEYAAKLVV